MVVSVLTICTILFSIVISSVIWKVLNWVWFRPKRLEKCLKQQGLKGTPYRILFGDLKESYKQTKEAKSKPINLSDDIATRVFPFLLQTVKNYGIFIFHFSLIFYFLSFPWMFLVFVSDS